MPVQCAKQSNSQNISTVTIKCTGNVMELTGYTIYITVADTDIKTGVRNRKQINI